MKRQEKSVSRRKSLRIPGYNYSQPNAYFVTVCSFRKRSIFGEILNGQISLFDPGKIVMEVWYSIESQYPTVELDSFVVMPNHIHGILKITSDEVGAIHELPLQRHGSIDNDEKRIRRRKMLLPKVVGYFKMNSSRKINQLRNSPGRRVWQRNYYEHVIRNERALKRLRKYIEENPIKWDDDPENPLRDHKGKNV